VILGSESTAESQLLFSSSSASGVDPLDIRRQLVDTFFDGACTPLMVVRGRGQRKLVGVVGCYRKMLGARRKVASGQHASIPLRPCALSQDCGLEYRADTSRPGRSNDAWPCSSYWQRTPWLSPQQGHGKDLMPRWQHVSPCAHAMFTSP